jgi:alkanesulfonate monooxygenase SsuD/methylene tetrahydromethanopterin reductase-like flavin-dependent oxidoreductase (luciferase family)
VLGIGVGGEDRREVSNSGVDPRTRGRRVDESLLVIRALQDGRAIDHHGEFFALEQARIVPAPSPRIPIVIGGRADAAITRTARSGDGWLGVFCSPRRYAETKRRIEDEAAALDRDVPDWFGLTVWCGLDDDPSRARALLDERLESLYKLPGERFARVAFAGTPAQVAEQLEPYVTAGARHISVIPAAASEQTAVETTSPRSRTTCAAPGPEPRTADGGSVSRSRPCPAGGTPPGTAAG